MIASTLPFTECRAVEDAKHEATQLARSGLSVLILGEPGTGRRSLATELAALSAKTSGAKIQLIDTNSGLLERLHHSLQDRGGSSFIAVVHDVGSLSPVEQNTLANLCRAKRCQILAVARAEGASEAGGHPNYRALTAELDSFLHPSRVTVVPLRERAEDLLKWADFFLKRASDSLRVPVRTLTPSARNAVCSHAWPGNLLELETTLARAACLSTDQELSAEMLGLAVGVTSVLPLKEAIDQFRTDYILKTVALFGGNRTRAAAALKVDPRTVFRSLESKDE